MEKFLIGVALGSLSPIALIWAIRAIQELPGAILDYIRLVKGLVTKKKAL